MVAGPRLLVHCGFQAGGQGPLAPPTRYYHYTYHNTSPAESDLRSRCAPEHLKSLKLIIRLCCCQQSWARYLIGALYMS